MILRFIPPVPSLSRYRREAKGDEGTSPLPCAMHVGEEELTLIGNPLRVMSHRCRKALPLSKITGTGLHSKSYDELVYLPVPISFINLISVLMTCGIAFLLTGR